MLDRVLKTISRYNMLAPGVRVIAAVSGGADSVCLLHVLKVIAPQALAGVAHFNHKWRGQASDDDERFVADLAAQLNLPFFRAEMSPVPGNLEQEARRARLAFFTTLPHPVALGHTRDDQAETVLFRLLRGSGLAGLAGHRTSWRALHPSASRNHPRRNRGPSARPRNPWREDASNLDLRFARNRIRHQLLPQLTRDWNPQLPEALAHLADLAYEEETWWGAHLDGTAGTDLPISVLSLPRAEARRLIRRAIRM